MESVAVQVPPPVSQTPGFAGSSTSQSSPPPFLSKTYDMVDDTATDSVVSWSKGSNSFVVWNVPEFSRTLLPKYFKHNNFSSFVRQLNTYGFRKVDPDHWEFANEGFLKGQKHLLKRINRKKPSNAQSQPQQPSIQNTAAKSCVEVGKFGLEGDVEILKRDKNVLMQELVRLRQHQQTTDNQLHNVGQRVHVMEQRQQQMMSFLAKAMQRPGFLAQLVQQQNKSGQHIEGINRKRRLPNNEEDRSGGMNAVTSDGQIVKFQPLINDAAKSMLRQIMKLNTSPSRDQLLGDPNKLMINGFPPQGTLDGSYSSRSSGVTLAEMPPPFGQLSLPAQTPPSVSFSSVTSSDILSSSETKKNPSIGFGFPEGGVDDTEKGTMLPDYDSISSVLEESSAAFADMNCVGNEGGSSSVIAPASTISDATVPMNTDEFSPSLELDDVLLDSIPKLPGSHDAFWEQIFSAVSSPEDTEEVESGILEGGLPEEHELNVDQSPLWGEANHMSNITEQMELLTAESNSV